MQAKPLRELCECLGLIKKGIFVPDAARSGMFNKLAEAGQDWNEAPASSSPKPDESVPSVTMPEQSLDVSEQQEDEAGISNSSDESDSSGSSESDSVEYDRLPPPSSLDIAAPSIDQGLDLDVFQNPKSKSLHTRAKGSNGDLTCGRKVEGMKPFTSRVYSRSWMCKQCEKAKPLEDVGSILARMEQKRVHPGSRA